MQMYSPSFTTWSKMGSALQRGKIIIQTIDKSRNRKMADCPSYY